MSTKISRSGLLIEPASVPDVPLILSFIRGLAEYERAPQEVVATEEMLRETLFGEERFAECVIARQDDEPAGFALFFHNYSTWRARPGLYLEDLFVRPDMRGRGIGRALLLHLAQIARERGCARMDWAVLDWNEPAIKFYEKLGAVPMNEWTTYRLTADALDRLISKNEPRTDTKQ